MFDPSTAALALSTCTWKPNHLAEHSGVTSAAAAVAFAGAGESPTGYLPVLRLDGHNLIEHVSICRLLAKRVGTYGKDDRTDYLADALAEAASTGFRWA